MDKASAIDLARRYSELVIRHLPVKQVYLFGSYAREAAGPDSDIDIAVIVERLDVDYLDEQARLFRLRRSVDLRIEPVLIEDGDRSGILKSIRDTGYLVYPVASCHRDRQ
jgi:predicted nucleotidyltransferase